MVNANIQTENTQILVVEPDVQVQMMLYQFFQKHTNYTVHFQSLGLSALACIKKTIFDVIIIEESLPDTATISLIMEARKISCAAILIISTDSSIENRVRLLEAGADAQLDKPVDMRFLRALIDRLLIRVKQLHVIDDLINHAERGWTLSTVDWVLSSPDRRKVQLTATEYKILEILLQNLSTPVPREALAQALGRENCFNYDGHINTVICRLRKKITDQTESSLGIKAYRSEGYLLTSPLKFMP